MNAIEFRLNGKLLRADGISPNTTLLNYLRSRGSTGSKEGCAEGDCGACSVAIVDRDTNGNACFRAINSCLVPLPAIAGREIISVEGLKAAALHPVQQAMVDHHGSQCGYCTPGFVMSLFEGFHRKDLQTEAQLDEQLAGNLCRCTGYRPIRDAAVEAYAQRGSDAYAERLHEPAGELQALELEQNGERFFRPKALGELFGLMAKFPEARLVAGATELGLLVSKYFKKIETWISLEAIPELLSVEESEAEWRIGGAVNLTNIFDRIGSEFPTLGEMLRWFGSRQIRNRATMGGNLVTASPIGDSAPVLLTFDTKLVLASLAGERVVSLDEFFLAYRKTALRSGEILKTIILPRGDKLRRGFYKVAKRREMDISTVAACFAIEL
ncbi:MAG: xanthine dehydrogenase large subunit, partial [Chthoniobacter sp.]|nr:xanthine dehydrogenase large subunit [Chthoniobacter sp.]